VKFLFFCVWSSAGEQSPKSAQLNDQGILTWGRQHPQQSKEGNSQGSLILALRRSKVTFQGL
jgi:hypothetical protein